MALGLVDGLVVGLLEGLLLGEAVGEVDGQHRAGDKAAPRDTQPDMRRLRGIKGRVTGEKI